MSVRKQGLVIQVVNGRLEISIGVDTLMVAAAAADAWNDDRFRITDRDAFAESIVRGLEDEQEDGTTPVHVAIDTAVMWAVENAEPGVEEIGFDADDGDDE